MTNPTNSTPEYVETLNEFFARKPMELSLEDLETIVKGFHEQSARWEAESAKGSRKRVSSKTVPTGKNAVAKSFEGLKL